ncbi:uncharacterized protein AUP68_07426 [Ilyonectria robusta]
MPQSTLARQSSPSMNDLDYDDKKKTMPELDQSTPPATGNKSTTANSLKVAPEGAPSVASGDIGRDVERQDGGVEKERATADGPPEGGFEAWTVVLGAWCCSFCCYGWINKLFLKHHILDHIPGNLLHAVHGLYFSVPAPALAN